MLLEGPLVLARTAEGSVLRCGILARNRGYRCLMGRLGWERGGLLFITGGRFDAAAGSALSNSFAFFFFSSHGKFEVETQFLLGLFPCKNATVRLGVQ